jgi:hypothetical protein
MYRSIVPDLGTPRPLYPPGEEDWVGHRVGTDAIGNTKISSRYRNASRCRQFCTWQPYLYIKEKYYVGREADVSKERTASFFRVEAVHSPTNIGNLIRKLFSSVTVEGTWNLAKINTVFTNPPQMYEWLIIIIMIINVNTAHRGRQPSGIGGPH